MKNELLKFISQHESDDVYSSLESFALFVLKEKIATNSASAEERLLLINDFLSNYLEFDTVTDEPIGRTNEIKQMIDFLLNNCNR